MFIDLTVIIIWTAIGGWYVWSKTQSRHVANIFWIATALRQRADFWELKGDETRAAEGTGLADALIDGVNIGRSAVPDAVARRRVTEQATMTVSGGYWLNSMGVTDHSHNYLPSMAALYWLGGRMSARK